MRDLIVGRIKSVIGSDLIKVVATQVVRRNHHEFGPEEMVRVKGLKSENSRVLEKVKVNKFHDARLTGRGVMCLVHSREAGGNIQAEIYILSGNAPHGEDETAHLHLSESSGEIFIEEGGVSQ